MSDPTTTPTPTNERQAAPLARIFWDAWLAAQDQSRADQAAAGINAVLAAVSAAAPDEREAACDPWLACPVHGTEHWREYAERARDDAARRVASHIRHGGSADLWPEPDGFTSPEPPEPTTPQGVAIAGGLVGREALADVLAESRRTGLGGMTERQACLHMADAVMAWFTSRAALAARPAPTVSGADVERALEALLRFPATFEGTRWVSAAALRGLIDSTAWATVQPGTVDQVAAILRVHYDHPDGEGSVECVCGGYEGPGDIFDHQAERIIAALGITVADAPAADDEGGQA